MLKLLLEECIFWFLRLFKSCLVKFNLISEDEGCTFIQFSDERMKNKLLLQESVLDYLYFRGERTAVTHRPTCYTVLRNTN